MKHCRFYAMLSRMKYIARWSLMRNTRSENVCEHSYDVAVIAHALAAMTNQKCVGAVNVEKCVTLALYHDTPEILTGDLPTPVKYYNHSIRDAYQQVEEISANELLMMLPEDLRDEYRSMLLPDETTLEYRLVKAADKIAALIKCVEELKAGNTEFSKARQMTEESIRRMGIEAADRFLDECLPPFSLTLDEQK